MYGHVVEGGRAGTTAPRKAADDGASVGTVGTPVRDGKFESTVVKLDPRRLPRGTPARRKAQGEFRLAHLTIKNIGDEPQSVFGDDHYLFTADRKRYSADTEAAIYVPEPSSLYEAINPGTLSPASSSPMSPGDPPANLALHESTFAGGVELG